MNEFIKNLKEKKMRNTGQKLLTSGKLEEAEQKFRKALLLNASSENQFNLGLALMSLYKYTEAEQMFRKVIAEHPGNPLNLISLSEALLMQKKWADARSVLQDLLKIEPEKTVYLKQLQLCSDVIEREKYVTKKELMNKAEQEQNKKNYNEALKLLQEVLQFDKKSALVLNNIGSIYAKLNNFQEAYRYVEQAQSLDTKNQHYRRNLVEIKNKLRK